VGKLLGCWRYCKEELPLEPGPARVRSLPRRARFNDLPGEYESILVENADGPGPFGAKGMGEGGIISSFLLGRDEIVRDKHQMALQSCLYHGSITHLKCSYGPATQMSVTITMSGLGQHVAWSFLSDRG